MNKAELIAAVAENAELTKKDAEKAVKAFIEVVTPYHVADECGGFSDAAALLQEQQ